MDTNDSYQASVQFPGLFGQKLTGPSTLARWAREKYGEPVGLDLIGDPRSAQRAWSYYVKWEDLETVWKTGTAATITLFFRYEWQRVEFLLNWSGTYDVVLDDQVV